MRKFIGLILILFLGFSLFSQPNKKIKLVVGIVVQQMRYDFLTRYWDKYSENGFKLLMREGVVYHNAGYDYLNINTASSLTNIATGTHPYIHGIVGYKWYNKMSRRFEDCVEDRETIVIDKKGIEIAGSPKKVLAQTFSDALSMYTLGEAQIIVIAPKMADAILSAGKFADGVYWFDEMTGKWVTSSYYRKSTLDLPKWVKTFNRRRFPNVYLDNVWETSYPVNQYTESMPDERLGEKGFAGQTTFPYDLRKLSRQIPDYTLFMHTPYFNTFIKDFAISSMVYQGVGKDDIPDYLFIVFGANSYISQIFGIRSVEVEDAYIKLDKDIAHLIKALDDIVGREHYILFLTSDRGACENPNVLRNLGIKPQFFYPEAAKTLINAYLRAFYDRSDLVDEVTVGNVYFYQTAIDRMRIDPLEIQRYTANILSQMSSVQYVIPTQVLLNNSFSSDLLYLAYHSYHPKRSGDVLFTLKPAAYEDNKTHTIKSFSECYCQCNNQNHLPLIFFGGGLKHKDIYKHVDITSIAPTLSAFLGIQLPENATAPILTEIVEQR